MRRACPEMSDEQLELRNALFDVEIAEAQASISRRAVSNGSVNGPAIAQLGECGGCRQALNTIERVFGVGHQCHDILNTWDEAHVIAHHRFELREATAVQSRCVFLYVVLQSCQCRFGLEIRGEKNSQSSVCRIVGQVFDLLLVIICAR